VKWRRPFHECVGTGPPRSVSVLACCADDRDLGPGPGIARVRSVAGIGLHDDDLFDVAADDRARLGDHARDNDAHELGDARWRWRRVASIRRPGSTAVRRRKAEEVVLESGETLHRARRWSPAHEIDICPLTAPPRDVVSESGFQVTDDESRAFLRCEGEDSDGARGSGGGAAVDVGDRCGDQEGPGRGVRVSSADCVRRVARTTGDRAGRARAVTPGDGG
jgi:hypothetical protein